MEAIDTIRTYPHCPQAVCWCEAFLGEDWPALAELGPAEVLQLVRECLATEVPSDASGWYAGAMAETYSREFATYLRARVGAV